MKGWGTGVDCVKKNGRRIEGRQHSTEVLFYVSNKQNLVGSEHQSANIQATDLELREEINGGHVDERIVYAKSSEFSRG